MARRRSSPPPALGPEVRGLGDPGPLPPASAAPAAPRRRSVCSAPTRLPHVGLLSHGDAAAGPGRGRGAPHSGCRAPAMLVPWPARPRPPLGPRGARGAALCRGRGRRLEGSRVLACPQGASQERVPRRRYLPPPGLRLSPSAARTPAWPASQRTSQSGGRSKASGPPEGEVSPSPRLRSCGCCRAGPLSRPALVHSAPSPATERNRV